MRLRNYFSAANKALQIGCCSSGFSRMALALALWSPSSPMGIYIWGRVGSMPLNCSISIVPRSPMSNRGNAALLKKVKRSTSSKFNLQLIQLNVHPLIARTRKDFLRKVKYEQGLPFDGSKIWYTHISSGDQFVRIKTHSALLKALAGCFFFHSIQRSSQASEGYESIFHFAQNAKSHRSDQSFDYKEIKVSKISVEAMDDIQERNHLPCWRASSG